MDLGITGKTALVLGGGGGLGSAVCEQLAREGVQVAAADISVEALAVTAEKLEAIGSRHMTLTWNLADIASTEAHLAAIASELGPIDILFNNTGGPAPSPAYAFDENVLSDQFRSMVMSVMSITSQVLPGMRERRWGRIITSASSGVVAPIPNLSVSNALRLSLVGWSKTLAREVAADGVTVNVVVPGRIGTQRTTFLDEAKAKRENSTAQAVAAESRAGIPANRYGTPQEYANAVAFLASAGASYITGTQLRVDGGLLGNI